MTSSNSSGDGSKGGDSLASLLKTMGGDDCDRPACDDTKSALSAALRRMDRRRGGGGDGGDAFTEKSAADAPNRYRDCPPTRDDIGASTWLFLHSMAAWYPNKPTREDKQLMSAFMNALAKFYPCSWCASDFQKNVQLSPPRTETREDLCIWLCEQHNIVNEKLGKPLFHCSMKNLDERWRKSSDSNCQK
ncbi:hypothetical protein ACHAXA_004886 [Cyclostephanos tholiformis]|uniref:Sulfhydryl oxidase n=1 Tax=Cyclostephanos tholiformis TaxID=382380 RepID=A0ABD3RTK7_9STRA